MSDIRELPNNVERYAASPLFSSANIPDKFLSDHDIESGSLSTVPDKLLDVHDLKNGTWGRLNVQIGRVDYFLAGQTTPLSHIKAGETFVIRPEEKHFIKISDDAVFFIEFLREPKTRAASVV